MHADDEDPHESMKGSLSPATISRVTPVASMMTVRMTPPDDPSRAMACESAVRTNVSAASLDMPGRNAEST